MPLSSSPKTKHRLPLYRAAEQQILKRIKKGIYSVGQRLEAVETLSADFNVSPSTVRQSLQSLAAQGILECVPGRGTSVSQNALNILTPRVAETGTQNAYSIITPDIRYMEFSSLAHSVQEVAREQQVELVVYNTGDDLERYQQELDRLIRNKPEGIIVVPPLNETLPLESLIQLQESGIPAVSCYRPIEIPSVPTVRQHIYATQLDSARHLIQTGSKVLGLLHVEAASPIDTQYFREGLHGHKHAIMEGKLDFPDELLLGLDAAGTAYHEWAACYAHESRDDHSLTHEKRVERTSVWLRENPEIDGVICFNDYLAPVLMKAMARLGRTTPDDISIIVRGSIGSQIYMPKPVTMMDVNLEEFGRRACSLLQRMSSGEKFKSDYFETVTATLVARDTTRPLPSC